MFDGGVHKNKLLRSQLLRSSDELSAAESTLNPKP